MDSRLFQEFHYVIEKFNQIDNFKLCIFFFFFCIFRRRKNNTKIPFSVWCGGIKHIRTIVKIQCKLLPPHRTRSWNTREQEKENSQFYRIHSDWYVDITSCCGGCCMKNFELYVFSASSFFIFSYWCCVFHFTFVKTPVDRAVVMFLVYNFPFSLVVILLNEKRNTTAKRSLTLCSYWYRKGFYGIFKNLVSFLHSWWDALRNFVICLGNGIFT